MGGKEPNRNSLTFPLINHLKADENESVIKYIKKAAIRSFTSTPKEDSEFVSLRFF